MSTNRQDLGTTGLDISITEIRRAGWANAVLAQVARAPERYVPEHLLTHIVAEVGPDQAQENLEAVLQELEESRMILRLPIGVCPTEAGAEIGRSIIAGQRQPRRRRPKGAR